MLLDEVTTTSWDENSSYLERLLVLLGLGMVDLLDSAYVLLEIDNGMLPSLKSFRKEAGGLKTRLVFAVLSAEESNIVGGGSSETYAAGVYVWHSLVAVCAHASRLPRRQL
jgi:hypothetical protein